MMNIIGIMLDSFRQDHLGVYHRGRPAFPGVPACQTPNIDAFARECIVFDNAYPETLPTIPVRYQLFSGQSALPFRSWQPLVKEDLSAAEILGAAGYVNGLISDCYHYRAPGMNYHRGFHAYHWIRGQEYDPWRSNPPRRSINDYVNANYDQAWRDRIAQFLANTDDFASPDDWFASQVVSAACDWLGRNRAHRRIFAWIDSFEPHEPWDPPTGFDTYTDPAYTGKRLIMPLGGLAARWASPAEINHIRGLYAGEAAFVDHCLGRLFAALRDLGYYNDSVIVLLADHGHPLGDHGKFLKGGDRLYSELLHVPFMIRLPAGQGARCTPALVQFHDLLPTLLELIGLADQALPMHGRSFLPVLRGERDDHRSSIICGYHEAPDRCIRDRTWSYIQRPTGEPDELYHLVDDPTEQHNLIDTYPAEARRLAAGFGSLYQRGRAPQPVKGLQGLYELGSANIS